MCKVNIEKCIEFVDNKFDLVLIASGRARDLTLNNVKPFIKTYKDKPSVIALKEIAGGYNIKNLDEFDNKDI